jgi:hypothetical protein
MDKLLSRIKQLVYDKCDFVVDNIQYNTESIEYGACSFTINGKKIVYRVSKITPKKVGQFVTIWQRNKDGITEPYDVSDDLDFIIITSASETQLGQFVFPKAVLVQHGIVTNYNKAGKRGIRVYPPWEITTNAQAKKTQLWQLEYFIQIVSDDSRNILWLKQLINQSF